MYDLEKSPCDFKQQKMFLPTWKIAGDFTTAREHSKDTQVMSSSIPVNGSSHVISPSPLWIYHEALVRFTVASTCPSGPSRKQFSYRGLSRHWCRNSFSFPTFFGFVVLCCFVGEVEGLRWRLPGFTLWLESTIPYIIWKINKTDKGAGVILV